MAVKNQIDFDGTIFDIGAKAENVEYGDTNVKTFLDQIGNGMTGNVIPLTQSIPATAAAYHTLWDAFVTSGKASRSTMTTVSSKPVYLYHVNTDGKHVVQNGSYVDIVTDGSLYSKKKVLIISGIHGDEKGTPLALYEFVNRLLNDERYAGLRALYEWWFVPLVNPTGYDANTRANVNNVDINRDAINQVAVESQSLISLLNERHYDVFIDMHQLSEGSGSSTIVPQVCSTLLLAYASTQEQLDKEYTIYSAVGAQVDAIMNKTYNKSVGQTCYPWDSTDKPTFRNWAKANGKADLSMTFETTEYAYLFSGSDTRYNEVSLVYTNTLADMYFRTLLGQQL